MFVFSLKAGRVKVLCASLLAVAAAFATVTLFPKGTESLAVSVDVRGEKIRFDGMKSADDLKKFAENLGFSVESAPTEVVETAVPAAFDKTMRAYNALQKAMGFDLSPYRNKTVERTTFRVTGLPDHASLASGETLLTLIVFKDRIIGGDLYTRGEDGDVKPFLK